MRYFVICALLLLTAVIGFLSVNAQSDAPQRDPYDHVMRITAELEFDGHQVIVDDLIDCLSEYRGTPTQAAHLTFSPNRHRLVYDTDDGGMIVITISRNICSSYADEWADGAKRLEVPDAWIPLISWYDNRDYTKIINGETYWSETALNNPNGRVKVVSGFRVTIPEQSEAVIAEAKRQVVERDVWLGNRPRGQNWGLNLKDLHIFTRVPETEWSQPPKNKYPLYQSYSGPKQEADWEGLRDKLQALPEGEGLLLLKKYWGGVEQEVVYAVRDLIIERVGSKTAVGNHGIPQADEYLYGMFLNERAWNRAKENVYEIPFLDKWISFDLREDGVLVLRTDTPGVRYHTNGKWYEGYGMMTVDFLGKEVINGPWQNSDGYLVFDLETRDLWVKSGS